MKPTRDEIDRLQEIHRICCEFESNWQQGRFPVIEDYVGRCVADLQPRLFLALLQSELELRLEQSDHPRRREYVERFPEYADLIDSALAESGLNLEAAAPAGAVGAEGNALVIFAESGERLRIGHFRILSEIARGGMGVVYLAEDENMKREVALKVILAGHFASPIEVQRFELEARAIARLDHPGITQVLEFGQWAGHHYLAMVRVVGEDLSKRLMRGPFAERAAAELIRQLADALNYAHSAGVVHRDLKPRNILIDQRQQPRITDFGLAKILHDASIDARVQVDTSRLEHGVTGTGQILGTPHYMSPEQAAGRQRDVGPLSDIYSLGIVFYELIAGQVPFRGESVFDVLQAIQTAPPPRLDVTHPGLSRDLVTICEKCIEKDPQHRYASAADLRDDLDRFLHGIPIHARPISVAGRAWRWCRRHPAFAVLSAGLIATVVVAIVTLSFMLHRIQTETSDKTEALVQSQQAMKEREETLNELRSSQHLALRRAYAARVFGASNAWNQHDVARAADLLQSVVPKGDEPDFRGFEWAYLHSQLFRGLVEEYQFEGGEISNIDFSPDGKRLLVCGGNKVSGYCELIDRTQRRRLSRFDDSNSIVHGAAFSPDGSRIALGSPADGLLIFASDLQTRLIADKLEGYLIRTIAWSPHDDLIAVGTQQGAIVLLKGPHLERTVLTEAHSGPVLSLMFSDDGSTLFSSAEWSAEGKITRHWDMHVWPPTLAGAIPGFAIADVAGGAKEILVTKVGTVARIRPIDGQVITQKQLSRGFLVGPKLIRQNQLILMASRSDRVVVELDSDSLTPLRRFPLRGSPTALAVARQRQGFACGDTTGMVRVWTASAVDDKQPQIQRDWLIQFVATATGNDKLLISGFQQTEYGKDRETLSTCDLGYVRTVDATGDTVATLTPPESLRTLPITVNIYKLPEKTLTCSFTLNERPHRDHLTLSPSGRWLSTHDESAQLMLFDLHADPPSQKVFPALCRYLVFSPDEQFVYTAEQFGRVRCINLATQTFEQDFASHESFWAWSFCLDCSHDGKRLAAGNDSGTVRIWETESRRLLATLLCSPGIINSIAFFPDGQRLAISDASGVRIWDVMTADELLQLPYLDSVIESVSVNSRGDTIFGLTAKGTVLLWESSQTGAPKVVE